MNRRPARPPQAFLDRLDAEVTRGSILDAAALVEALAAFAPAGEQSRNSYGAEAYERAVDLLAELQADLAGQPAAAVVLDYRRFCNARALPLNDVDSFDAWANQVGEYVAVASSAAIAAAYPGTDPTS